LTHRRVAARAGISLAATTYYFETKVDIVVEASGIVLRGYTDAFNRAAARIRGEQTDSSTFKQFVCRLIRHASRRDRMRTICWAEMILDARRHQESLMLARQSFGELASVWREIADAAGTREPAAVGRSAIDVVIGLLFMTIALGLHPDQIVAVLAGGRDLLESWVPKAPRQAQVPSAGVTQKSAETRERILAATVDLLISDGANAVTYRNIALKTGLTRATPFYHFRTVSTLLAAAEQRLFQQSKERYRAAASGDKGQRTFTLEQLIDRTAAVFRREVTEFGGRNLATYAIWLQAARDAKLRPMVWSAIEDQHRAWQRVLSRVMQKQRPADALVAQAGFIGKVVRVLATGASPDDLVLVKGEIAFDLTALSRGRFWL
jgi:AcrR family transcriptional regulator